ncbi:hypothetical protein [Oceanicella actignis]|uniref:hypothetical protein n=1 Tax=Oceanicella actignis TaxID=1189325 RepID=UPI00125671DE|nr:hypothetical protein [Oceanicella actignis]TYO91455.1 hypothetical protein LY05_00308 [Oceanicella actignis]
MPKLPAAPVFIVTHPHLFGDRPLLRRLAWAALMSARGRRMRQARIALDLTA